MQQNPAKTMVHELDTEDHINICDLVGFWAATQENAGSLFAIEFILIAKPKKGYLKSNIRR